MPIPTHKLATVLSAAALVGAGGIGIAEAARSGSDGRATARQHQRGPLPSSALEKIAETLGVHTSELRAALQANRPERPRGDRRGPQQLAADLAAELDVETARVQEILDANRPAKPAGRDARGTKPPRPDHVTLIAALASGLGLDQSAVTAAFDALRAAHDAEHEARHTAMYAAVAEALGRTTAEVRAAFEANRPAKPAR